MVVVTFLHYAALSHGRDFRILMERDGIQAYMTDINCAFQEAQAESMLVSVTGVLDGVFPPRDPISCSLANSQLAAL